MRSSVPTIDRSAFIHLARFVSAAVVAAAHLRDVAFPDYKAVALPPAWFKVLAGVTGFAGDAVMVFFVISGWLVGGGLLRNRSAAHPYVDYAIARVTRLWTVLLPLFLLQFAINGLGGGSSTGAYSLVTLGCNLVGLQTVYCDSFGGNFPLWSLANETAYYFVFMLVVASIDRRFTVPVRMALIVGALAYLAILTPSIRLYFGIWLVGCLASRVDARPSAALSTLALTVFTAIIVYKRAFNLVNVFPYDLVSSVALACAIVLLPRSGWLGSSRLPAALSSFSFSLYVTHIPAISLLGFYAAGPAPVSTTELFWYGLRLAALFAVAVIFSLAFEQQYARVRHALSSRLGTLSRGANPA